MRTIEERFWAKVVIREPEDCWPWTAGLTSKGYGQFKATSGQSPWKASRFAWKVSYGDPGVLLVCRRCDNPPCCNPAHLFLGTHADNIRDMVTKGRNAGRRPVAVAALIATSRRLTDVEIAAARLLVAAGRSYRSAGRQLGVAHTTIMRLSNGTHWAQI